MPAGDQAAGKLISDLCRLNAGPSGLESVKDLLSSFQLVVSYEKNAGLRERRLEFFPNGGEPSRRDLNSIPARVATYLKWLARKDPSQAGELVGDLRVESEEAVKRGNMSVGWRAAWAKALRVADLHARAHARARDSAEMPGMLKRRSDRLFLTNAIRGTVSRAEADHLSRVHAGRASSGIPRKRDVHSAVRDWTDDEKYDGVQALRQNKPRAKKLLKFIGKWETASRTDDAISLYMHRNAPRSPAIPQLAFLSVNESPAEPKYLYRGIRDDPKGLVEMIIAQGRTHFSGYQAFSRKYSVAERFSLRRRPWNRNGIVFRLAVPGRVPGQANRVPRGTPWVWFSASKSSNSIHVDENFARDEQEVLLPPGTLVLRDLVQYPGARANERRPVMYDVEYVPDEKAPGHRGPLMRPRAPRSSTPNVDPVNWSSPGTPLSVRQTSLERPVKRVKRG